jgi:hypothetical protein
MRAARASKELSFERALYFPQWFSVALSGEKQGSRTRQGIVRYIRSDHRMGTE